MSQIAASANPFEGATAIALLLEPYELDALIEWHRDEQFKCAEKEDYISAADHKRRYGYLKSLIQKDVASLGLGREHD